MKPSDEWGPTVVVPAAVWDQIDTAIRSIHPITYHMAPVAEAGLMNLLLWPTPSNDETIVLIRGES